MPATAVIRFSAPRVAVRKERIEGSLVYLIPIIVLALVVAVGAAWSPIFALIIAVPLFALFLAYVGLSRRSDEQLAGEAEMPRPEGTPRADDGEEGGLWGERRA